MGRQDNHLSYPHHSQADSYWERAWDPEDSVHMWSGCWACHLTFPHHKHLGHLEDLEVYLRGRKKKKRERDLFWLVMVKMGETKFQGGKSHHVMVFSVVCWFGDRFLRKSLRSFGICLFPSTSSNTRKTLTKSMGDNALGNWNYSVEAIWWRVWYSWNSWEKTPYIYMADSFHITHSSFYNKKKEMCSLTERWGEWHRDAVNHCLYTEG